MYSYLASAVLRLAIKTITSTATILAIDLGKYKSVASILTVEQIPLPRELAHLC